GTQNLGNAILNNITRNCWCPWTFVLPTPYTFFLPGVYTFTMTADPNNDYPECNEGNNVLVEQVTVIGGADMRVLSQFINPIPLNPGVNVPDSLIISYENIGNSNVTDLMDLRVLVDEVPLSDLVVPGVATGDHNSVAIPNTWSTSIPGAHIVRAIINYGYPGTSVVESNYSNNEATRAVIVGEAANPYIELYSVSKPAPDTNDYIHIYTRIGNNGDVACTGTVFYYYINNAGDTIEIGSPGLNFSVNPHDSVTLPDLPWVVVDNNTTLIARIRNVNVLEFNPDDDMATFILGGLNLSLTPDTVCAGQSSGTIIASATGGTAPYLYQWSNGYIGSTLTASPGTYSVTVTDNLGASKSVTGTIGIRPRPVPVISGRDSIVCVNTANHTYSTASGMSNYVWQISGGGSITSGGTSTDHSVTITWNTVGAQWISVSYTNSYGCEAASPTVYDVTVNPRPIPLISGPQEICAGTAGNVYATETGKTGYVWTVSTGGQIATGQGTNSLTVTWNTAGARTVSVNYNNTYGCSAVSPTVYNVTVNPIPVPTITGPAFVCIGSTGNIYTTEAGMNSYEWDIPTGGSITSGIGTNSISVTWNTSGAHEIYLFYINSFNCEANSQSVKTVMVHPLPVPTITGPANVNAGSTGNVYTTEANKSNYTWQ
ncbi:MAG: hypothetical protein WCM93_16830, partial [Bacteroidota bacterium]